MITTMNPKSMKSLLSLALLASALMAQTLASASTKPGLGMPAAVAALPLGPVSSSFPSRPIRIVVPSPPGGIADTMARAIAQQISEMGGQPVIVDNKPGADTVIGTDFVAKSPPDGYTLLAAPPNFALNPARYSKLPFDTAQSFAPISMIGASSLVLLANPGVNANSVGALIALGKANPGSLAYGSYAASSAGHFSAEWFKSTSGVDLINVPYKGAIAALDDLLANRIQLMFAPISLALGHIKSGKLQALAITSWQRSTQLPDVPTMAEAGVAGFEVLTWAAILAPAGTPQDVINKLNQLVVRALNAPALKDTYARSGMEVWAGSPEATRNYINADIDKYKHIAKASGIPADVGYGSPAALPTTASNAAPTAQVSAPQEANSAAESSPIADLFAAALISSLNNATSSALSQGGHTGLASLVNEMNSAMLSSLQAGGTPAAATAPAGNAGGGTAGGGTSLAAAGASAASGACCFSASQRIADNRARGAPDDFETFYERKCRETGAPHTCQGGIQERKMNLGGLEKFRAPGKAGPQKNDAAKIGAACGEPAKLAKYGYRSTDNPQVDNGCQIVAFNLCMNKEASVINSQATKAQCLVLRETAKSMGGSGTTCEEPCKAARLLPVQ